jgi:acyl carrier protein
METNEILNTLTEILRDLLKNDAVCLTPETQACDVNGWDSLTNMLLINHVEKQFNIHFNFREIARLNKVNDLCLAIADKSKQ